MEQQNKQQISCNSIDYRLPPISGKYPWVVDQNLDAEEDVHVFYNLSNPLSKYHYRIPELLRKRIRGCFHGWMILSDHPHNNNLTLSLWNPLTFKIICLPPLVLKDGDYESIRECCLSAPPDDPRSILILVRTNKPTFVFLRLNCKRNRLRWIEMSYDKQLKRITGKDGLLVYSLACCNGKVYALNICVGFDTLLIKVDFVVKDREVLVKLLLLGAAPSTGICWCSDWLTYLKGSSTELFFIGVGFHERTQKTPVGVCFFKVDMTRINVHKIKVFKGLDMTNMCWLDIMEDRYDDLMRFTNLWEETVDLKDAIFFVDISRDYSVFYNSTIGSKFGGFIHIRDKMNQTIYSYHVNKKTISLSSMASLVLPTSRVSMWECRLEEDHEEAKCTIDSKHEQEGKNREIVVGSVTDQEVEFNESHLLNLPFPILEMIMDLCICVEYMNFRATCKLCHIAAPLIQRRLQTYSFVSPWLVIVDKNNGILTFIDPIFGGNYFMKNIHVKVDYNRGYVDDEKIFCSRFGWLLFDSREFACLVFFNPFTSDLRKLPIEESNLKTICFSAPPTSPDCMVVGFSPDDDELQISIHFVGRESCWRTLSLGVDPLTIRFPTFKGRDLYALANEGELIVFKDLGEEDFSWKFLEAKAPPSCCKSLAKYFLLMTSDQRILLVVVGGEFGELVEVFEWNDATDEWEKIDSIGRHMIYICGTTCLCIEAKIPDMENKIYFPRQSSENGKIVFYSLETCMYHTFSDNITEENFADFIGTKNHLNPHAWIEPSWC